MMHQGTATEESIQRLQTATKSLTSIVPVMPGLRMAMYTDYYYIHNAGMQIVKGTGGIRSKKKIKVDWGNLSRATNVAGRASPGGGISACLELDGLPSIPLLHIGEPALVTQPEYRAKIMEAVAGLPLELRKEVYNKLARRLRQCYKDKQVRMAGLRQELKRLEGK